MAAKSLKKFVMVATKRWKSEQLEGHFQLISFTGKRLVTGEHKESKSFSNCYRFIIMLIGISCAECGGSLRTQIQNALSEYLLQNR